MVEINAWQKAYLKLFTNFILIIIIMELRFIWILSAPAGVVSIEVLLLAFII